MAKHKFEQTVMAWKKDTLEGRLEACRVMLHLHEIINDSENKKAKERLKKAVYREMRKQTNVEVVVQHTV